MISQCSRTLCSLACGGCLAIFEVADIHEQRINIKCCFKLGETFTETHEMMKNVYDDQCMSHTHCYECFKRYKDRQQSTNDELHLGRPSASCNDAHVAQVHEIMRSNRRFTVREIAEECNISIGSCHDICTAKLEIRWVVSKFVPQILTQDKRGSRVSVTNFWITLARMETVWKELQLAMKNGFMDMMWKRKCSLHKGLEKIRQDRKRCGRSGRTWKSC
jgi:hypothetical protein